MPKRLQVEVAEDSAFHRVVATAAAPLSAESDFTCRVLVGGLRPSTIYWYRFTDSHGYGSRMGRTITAPTEHDERPVRFAFVSCQNANQGAQNAYRRMIFEDERAPEQDRLGFVLHLGDFIYEIVWYPEDRPQGMYDRRLRDIVRYAHGEKIQDFHIPTDVDDYRASTVPICMILICRTHARAGRSSTCGTTTSTVGRAGKDYRSSGTRHVRHKRAKLQPTKHSSNISRLGSSSRADRRSIALTHHR